MAWVLIGGGILCFLYGLVYPFKAFKVMGESPNFESFSKKFWGFIGILLVMAFWWVIGCLAIGYGVSKYL